MGLTGEMLNKGETLFVQGKTPDGFYLLNSGSLEILYASEEYVGLDSAIILDKSQRVGFISGKSLILGFSDFCIGPYQKSIRATENCSIVKYPLNEKGFQDIVKKDPAKAVTLVRQLYKKINELVNETVKTSKLYENISMLLDNIEIIYSVLSESDVYPNLHAEAELLFAKFRSNNGNVPDKINAKFLITNNGGYIDKIYRYSDSLPADFVKSPVIKLASRIIRLDQKILLESFKSDSLLSADIYHHLTVTYNDSLNSIGKLYDKINSILESLFGSENSWASYLADIGGMEWKNSGKLSPDFFKNFLSLIVKINSIYFPLFGKKLTEVFPGVNLINSIHKTSKKADSVKLADDENNSLENKNGGFNRSIHKIFEFAFTDKEFQNKFLSLIGQFKSMSNPMNTESDGRKIRREISKLYWELYGAVFLRSKVEKTIPKVVKLMLNYGFLDEELLEEEQLIDLNELSKLRLEKSKYQILHEVEFLKLIYDEIECPSLTEMGQNYETYLRDMNKSRKLKDQITAGGENDNIDKTMFEIKQMLSSTAAVASGSTSTAFPILNSYTSKGSLKNLHVSKKRLEQLIDETFKSDYSLFYRETVLKMDESREIIKEEVIPYFILLPIFGTKVLLWQELTGTNKRTRGRIVVPMFFLGDLKKSLYEAFAAFRWELMRTMKGAMWADPIDGGLTGEYFDYVNTFKKNSKLSTEAKQKIATKFKSLRSNRDRFASDYMDWLLYEKDGIMKMNSVVRDMFYKHIPFSKEIRERLEKMPAFDQAAHRYKNISLRNYNNFERRFKKYMDDDGNYPKKIAEYMEFLKR